MNGAQEPHEAPSRVILGTMWSDWREVTDREVARRIGFALDRGVTAIDTAPLYGYGGVEERIGRALAGATARPLILTKVGLRWDGEHGDVLFREPWQDGGERVVRRDSRPDSIRRDVEESLERLAVERLDVVQIHQRDHRVPLSDSIGELMALVREGKVGRIAVSNFDAADTLESAALLGPLGLAWNQVQYSLVDHSHAERTFPALERVGAPAIAYSPTGSGLLGGSSLARRAESSRHARAVAGEIEATVAPVARDLGLTVPQLAIAWSLGSERVAAAIVGAREDRHLDEAVAASGVELGAPLRAHLAAAFAGLDPSMDLGPLGRLRSRARRAVRRLAKGAADGILPRTRSVNTRRAATGRR